MLYSCFFVLWFVSDLSARARNPGNVDPDSWAPNCHNLGTHRSEPSKSQEQTIGGVVHYRVLDHASVLSPSFYPIPIPSHTLDGMQLRPLCSDRPWQVLCGFLPYRFKGVEYFGTEQIQGTQQR